MKPPDDNLTPDGVITDDWTSCYTVGWGDLIVADAYCHPAKYSRALIQRIYQHAREEGWLTAGSTICDPFGGVALGGFDAAWNGCHWVGVELESKFVELGQQNIARWQERYGHMPGWGSVRLVQGDSRRLGEVVRETGLCVSSPPYSDFGRQQGTDNKQTEFFHNQKQGERANCWRDGYGSTPGQLGALPATDGGFNAAISSPPYADQQVGKGGDGRTGWRGYTDHGGGTSATEGQLAALPATERGFDAAVGSPPYARALGNAAQYADPEKAQADSNRDIMRQNAGKANDVRYGETPGQLGAMRDRAGGFDGVVSSPPYAASFDKYGKTDDLTTEGILRPSAYGNSSGQLASMSDPANGRDRGSRSEGDFWQAAKEILTQTYSILRPGAHACWVVKAFVRNKQIVDFPDQWRRLCESVGFRTLHLHRCWLVEVNGHQGRLDGGEADRVGVERKSFFRRLAESKGSPRIDYEVVLCMEVPNGR